MKVVHLFTSAKSAPARPKKLTDKQAKIARARRWQELQEQRLYRQAIDDNRAEIDKIRMIDPTWMPSKA
jgi:hypothetical protein